MALRSLITLILLSSFSLFAQAEGVRFALVKTSETETLDAFTVAGGKWTEKVKANHTAVLIQHHAATLLFDTGLGRQVDRQFKEEMPWWEKPLMQYGAVTPARDQLDRAGIRVDRILLSHAHWDHASALADFAEVPVWAPYEEIEFSEIATPPAILPSQFAHRVNWHPFEFQPEPFMGFDRSLDLFGDRSLVLVPLDGHTPGSTGLFLTLEDGRRFFFTGDASWRLEGFTGPKDKFWLSSRLVDNDRAGTHAQLRKVHDLLKATPGLTLIPAHDAQVQDRLGYYPRWIQ
ncbi:MBL fold metallo-hydrolase [Metapseudomonas furukawaii]|uniref:Metal-dependent hydrolase n=1 Tax=Metapseudomonas furukawaii TaxID=1149133 RepID=A0AAD1FHA3_METFU|nr:MBL fold metallo-hydrolase [Pseudomonas furukawaii]ELS28592.1 Zn-dependent hydrolase [Pseudomonas furukawaii]BAU75178.1 metal-dependent hydrolase [Pseudomonas furukawaii]